MKVIIKNQKVDLKVTTVVLTRDDDPTRLKMFFCPVCQNPIAQYSGQIFSLMPGHSDVGLPILLRCSNCKSMYSMLSVV